MAAGTRSNELFGVVNGEDCYPTFVAGARGDWPERAAVCRVLGDISAAGKLQFDSAMHSTSGHCNADADGRGSPGELRTLLSFGP